MGRAVAHARAHAEVAEGGPPRRARKFCFSPFARRRHRFFRFPCFQPRKKKNSHLLLSHSRTPQNIRTNDQSNRSGATLSSSRRASASAPVSSRGKVRERERERERESKTRNSLFLHPHPHPLFFSLSLSLSLILPPPRPPVDSGQLVGSSRRLRPHVRRPRGQYHAGLLHLRPPRSRPQAAPASLGRAPRALPARGRAAEEGDRREGQAGEGQGVFQEPREAAAAEDGVEEAAEAERPERAVGVFFKYFFLL